MLFHIFHLMTAGESQLPVGMGKEDQEGFIQEAEGWTLKEKDIPGRGNNTNGMIRLA